ncbi:acetylglutamate kinase [Spirochaetota bacterium]|nr:acetylglutamate kinase [Spirochaetota bacterium]
MKQAAVLIEALPYIKKFRGQRMVIKIGGSVLDSDLLVQTMMQNIVLLTYIGVEVVIVHGGGKHISTLLKRMGKESSFVAGLRVTDDETMEITQMVLAGWLNKNLTALIEQEGGKAVGISGKDASLLVAKRLQVNHVNYGRVGKVAQVNSKLLETLLRDGFIPVVSPIASDGAGGSLNVNADTVAYEIAAAIHARKLIVITDVKGIYKDVNDETSLLTTIRVSELADLMDRSVITGGMLPKLESANRLIKNTHLEALHLISGKIPHALLLELFTQKGIGTKLY